MDSRETRSRTYTWADPAQVVSAAPGKTGLELLNDIAAGRLPPPPISRTMGFDAVHFELGKAVFEGDPSEFLYNPIGVVHAGFAMTLLDSAMACAVHSTLDAGERYTSLEVKSNFVRPITAETGRVRAEANVVHRGRTTATAEGRLTAIRDGKLLAHGSTTCLIMPARSE